MVLAACAPTAARVPAGSADASRVVALPNADLEMPMPAGSRCPPRWGCAAHAGPDSHRFFLDERTPAQGARSLCIERVRPEPWAIATVSIGDPALRGRRLRFSLQVRLDGVAGGAGPWVVLNGAQGNLLLHEQRLAGGTAGWRRMAVEFEVPRETQTLQLGATLEGAGRVCVDDARLEIL
jgi:hypothetical protein